MLSDVIRYMIERQPDMEVMGEVLDPPELLRAVAATGSDVVIVTPLDADGEPHLCTQLLAAHPQLAILTQPETASEVFLYKSGAQKIRIAEPSAQSILQAIRECTGPIID